MCHSLNNLICVCLCVCVVVHYCRLGEGGELSGEEWRSAPRAVVESLQRSLRSGGGECVMVRGGEMVNTQCSEELRYVCVFSYPGENSIMAVSVGLSMLCYYP